MNTKLFRPPWIGSLPLLVILLTVLLSACGSATATSAINAQGTTAATSSSGTTTMGTSSNVPGGAQIPQLLLKMAQAMQQVKFVHVDVTSHGTLQSTGGALPASMPQKATYTLTLRINIAVASQQESDKAQLLLNQGQNKTAIALTEVISNHKLYSKVIAPPALGNQKTIVPQWVIIDLAALSDLQQVSAAGNQMQGQLPLIMQNTMITDKGMMQLKGAPVHHVTVVLSQQGLDQGTASTTQPIIKQVLSSIHLQTPLQVDLFINEGSALLQRMVIKGQLQINLDMLIGKGRIKQSDVGVVPHMLETNIVATLSFSHYNQPVQIRVPKTAAQPQ